MDKVLNIVSLIQQTHITKASLKKQLHSFLLKAWL